MSPASARHDPASCGVAGSCGYSKPPSLPCQAARLQEGDKALVAHLVKRLGETITGRLGAQSWWLLWNISARVMSSGDLQACVLTKQPEHAAQHTHPAMWHPTPTITRPSHPCHHPPRPTPAITRPSHPAITRPATPMQTRRRYDTLEGSLASLP